MRIKNEFGFEHNATESRFVANRMFEFLILILLSKRDKVCKDTTKRKEQDNLPKAFLSHPFDKTFPEDKANEHWPQHPL